MYKDLYFLNPQEALKVASQQNRWNDGYSLQVCYYNGEKIDSELPNLIHLPLNNLLDDLSHGIYRIPSKIDFSGLELSWEIKAEIEHNFNATIQQAKTYRSELNSQYLRNSRNAKPDFTEPLRFYLHTNSNTDVMQYISKNIAQAIESIGYNVKLNIYIGIEDRGCLKVLSEFNPHATININHLNNDYISNDVFNFIWFQDYMPIFTNDAPIHLRDRDFVLHLIDKYAELLSRKNVKSIYQPFCINENIFKKRDYIKKEKKIIFIGSSYKSAFDKVTHKKKHKIAKLLLEFYLSDKDKSPENFSNYRTSLKKKFNIATDLEIDKIINYVERDMILLHIANMNLGYLLEVYGWGWENTNLKNFYQGSLSYGEEISKVYNSAQYALVLGGYVLQQRTLEAAASGCIPLIFETPTQQTAQEDKTCFKESLIFFNKPDDIASLLNKSHNIDLNCIVEANSYKHLIEKFVNIVKREM